MAAHPPFPAQTESQRKLELMLQAVKNFDSAKHWEMSVRVMQELADAYERKVGSAWGGRGAQRSAPPPAEPHD